MRQIDVGTFPAEATRAWTQTSRTPGAFSPSNGAGPGLSHSSFFGSLSSRILWPGAGMNPPWLGSDGGFGPQHRPTERPIGGIAPPPFERPPFERPVGGIMPPPPEFPRPERPVGGIAPPPQRPDPGFPGHHGRPHGPHGPHGPHHPHGPQFPRPEAPIGGIAPPPPQPRPERPIGGIAPPPSFPRPERPLGGIAPPRLA